MPLCWRSTLHRWVWGIVQHIPGANSGGAVMGWTEWFHSFSRNISPTFVLRHISTHFNTFQLCLKELLWQFIKPLPPDINWRSWRTRSPRVWRPSPPSSQDSSHPGTTRWEQALRKARFTTWKTNYGGFLSHRATPSYRPLIFPEFNIIQPSSYWGTPNLGKPTAIWCTRKI